VSLDAKEKKPREKREAQKPREQIEKKNKDNFFFGDMEREH